MPFYRAQYDTSTGQSPNMPREQVRNQTDWAKYSWTITLDLNVLFQKNKMTSWIDGSFIYSTVEPWVNLMRSYENG